MDAELVTAIAAAGISGAAAGIAVWQAVIARQQARTAEEAARLAERQAAAADRQARSAEEQVELMRQQIEGEEAARRDSRGPEFETGYRTSRSFLMTMTELDAYLRRHGRRHRFEQVRVEQVDGPRLAFVKVSARAEGYCGMWDPQATSDTNPPAVVDHVEIVRPVPGQSFTVGVVRDPDAVHQDAPIQLILDCKALDSDDTWRRYKTRLVEPH